jgi:hypothetical protein
VQVVRSSVLSAMLSRCPGRRCYTPHEELATVQTFLAGCHTIADEHSTRRNEFVNMQVNI